MEWGELEERCEYAAETVIPFFEDRYDISIDQPTFSGTLAGYTSISTAMEYRPTSNIVKVREDMWWRPYSLGATVAHEIGHAAIYQNSDLQGLRDTDAYDYNVLRSISEGVAQRFGREGSLRLSQAAAEEYNFVDSIGYVARLAFDGSIHTAWDATAGRVLPSWYSMGRDIFRFKGRGYVEQAIKHPETIYADITAQQTDQSPRQTPPEFTAPD